MTAGSAVAGAADATLPVTTPPAVTAAMAAAAPGWVHHLDLRAGRMGYLLVDRGTSPG